jgi:stearoyl-CoA desaturase (delta-9 desaturase)
VLAIITMGEGWHNNHHHYQVSARQGFFWWEIDLTYYILRGLAAVGLIWDLHGVPHHIRGNAANPDGDPVTSQLLPSANEAADVA